MAKEKKGPKVKKDAKIKMTNEEIFNDFIEQHSHLFDGSTSARDDSVTVTDDLIWDFAEKCSTLKTHMRNLTDTQLKAVVAAAQSLHRAAYEEMDDRSLWEDDED